MSVKRCFKLKSCAIASVLLSAFVFSLPALAVDSVVLKYDVKMNGLTVGEATHTVDINGNRYTITDVEKATGVVGLFVNTITRKSQGTIQNNQLRPTAYSETTKKSARTANLNWQTKVATFTVDANKKTSFNDHTVDRVSFPYQYYVAQKAPPSGSFNQMVADVKRVENQAFRTVGSETIDTPMGKINTILLERAGDAKNMKLWVSPQHGYLPVRILFIDKKDNKFDQVIREISKK